MSSLNCLSRLTVPSMPSRPELPLPKGCHFENGVLGSRGPRWPLKTKQEARCASSLLGSGHLRAREQSRVLLVPGECSERICFGVTPPAEHREA